MSRFAVRHGRFGRHPSIVLEDGASQACATLCSAGATLLSWVAGGLTHLFTGDTLARARRTAIAIEPVSAMTDAFNHPGQAAAIRLAPGATRRFHCGATLRRGAA